MALRTGYRTYCHITIARSFLFCKTFHKNTSNAGLRMPMRYRKCASSKCAYLQSFLINISRPKTTIVTRQISNGQNSLVGTEGYSQSLQKDDIFGLFEVTTVVAVHLRFRFAAGFFVQLFLDGLLFGREESVYLNAEVSRDWMSRLFADQMVITLGRTLCLSKIPWPTSTFEHQDSHGLQETAITQRLHKGRALAISLVFAPQQGKLRVAFDCILNQNLPAFGSLKIRTFLRLSGFSADIDHSLGGHYSYGNAFKFWRSNRFEVGVARLDIVVPLKIFYVKTVPFWLREYSLAIQSV